ncbi:hypothetical protein C8F01DRAFT_785111 [Mycena amicta]|nr:hypothetical protein C8F01DRAFT_785111 [Mycena amicta]
MTRFFHYRSIYRIAIDGLPKKHPQSLTATRRARLWDDNENLVHAVQKENFAGADRIHQRLVSECTPIHPHPAYERAALAQIRHRGQKNIQVFRTWLELVPDCRDPDRVEGGPFTKTRELLFRSGSPARHLSLLSQFSLVCAEKGYGKLVWDDLVVLMVKFQEPAEAVALFRSFEEAVLRYYSKHWPARVDEIANRQRNALIRICCAAGWLEAAVQLVKDSSSLRIGPSSRELIALLRDRGQIEQIPLVLNHHTLNILPFSTKAVIDRWSPHLPRHYIASQLRQVKNLISRRALITDRPPGLYLHALIAQYEATTGYRYGLAALRRRALSQSDGCSYTWLIKEFFYLREARRFADIVALFYANFFPTFLPRREGRMLYELAARHADPLLPSHSVPMKLRIRRADAWVIWNALVRLVIYLPKDIRLRTLRVLRHAVGQYASVLTDDQFRATPTSYTAVFRSIIWAYGQLGNVGGAISATKDVALLGKVHQSNVGLLDELTAVHARKGNIDSVTKLLDSLDSLGPRVQTYGLVIDAYLEAGLVDFAFQTEFRMKQKCDYLPGANWRLDRSLAKLEVLRAEEDVIDGDLT